MVFFFTDVSAICYAFILSSCHYTAEYTWSQRMKGICTYCTGYTEANRRIDLLPFIQFAKRVKEAIAGIGLREEVSEHCLL